MADTSDDKKGAEGTSGDAAYDVLEKDFLEVSLTTPLNATNNSRHTF